VGAAPFESELSARALVVQLDQPLGDRLLGEVARCFQGHREVIRVFVNDP